MSVTFTKKYRIIKTLMKRIYSMRNKKLKWIYKWGIGGWQMWV